MPKYFGIESANTYAKLGVRHNLTEKFGVLAHVGMSSFEKEVKVLTKNYSDHRVGLVPDPDLIWTPSPGGLYGSNV